MTRNCSEEGLQVVTLILQTSVQKKLNGFTTKIRPIGKTQTLKHISFDFLIFYYTFFFKVHNQIRLENVILRACCCFIIM